MGLKRKHTETSSDEVEVNTPPPPGQNLPAPFPLFDSSLFKRLSKDQIFTDFITDYIRNPAHHEAMQHYYNLARFGTFDEDAYVAAADKYATPQLIDLALDARDRLIEKYPQFEKELIRLRNNPANTVKGDRVIMNKNQMLEIAKELGVAVYTASADISGMDKKGEPAEDEAEHIVRRAATTTDLVALKNALETSPDKNRKDDEGKTALIIACSLGKAECVEILLEAGVDVNARDKSDSTALHYAVTNIECVELLLKHGADITLRNREGLTPIEAAKVTNQSEELLKLFQMHMLRTSDQVCLDTHT